MSARSGEPTPWQERAEQILAADLEHVHTRTDRVFAALMVLQWIAGVAGALWLSPLTWDGTRSQVHLHVLIAVWLGGLISLLPVVLAARHPGRRSTRQCVAVSQALTSALLIHLTGGRLETHFHVFGSLAFLAFYRDWRVLVTASLIVGLDHFLRGLYWPESVYGIVGPAGWRWAEHVGWVVFEDAFLVPSCLWSLSEMRASARRQAELEYARGQIEGIVVERTAELEIARDRALASGRAKAEFLARMSHEIRTPLNGVIGMCDLLGTTRLAPEQQDHLETMRTCSSSLLALVNEVLDYSRIEAGGLGVEAIDFDVREVVDATLEALDDEASRRGLELSFRIDSGVPDSIRGDPTRLRQVLLNLVGNALKFTERGSVTLRVRLQAAADGGAKLRFEVCDTGIGIAPESQAGLFEPFTQANGTMTRRFGGSGLGLAISRRLVQLMEGEIGFTSEPGKGSEFFFVLPLVKGASLASTSEEAACAGRRLLLVGPESVREALESALTGLRVRLDHAQGEQKALHRLVLACRSGEPYDCVLIEPDGSVEEGLELGRRILGLPAAHAPVLFLLAPALRAPNADEVRQAGFAGVLPKPVRRGRLVRRLAALAGHPYQARAMAPALPQGPPAPLDAGPRPRRLLLAEDNAVNQRVLLKMLARLGWEADVAGDGRAAVAAVARTRYDLVLMDCQMPELDGYQATREIRALPHGHGLPIVALTANALPSDRDECMRAGMDDFLAKPVELRRLESVLEHWHASVTGSRRSA